MNGGIILGGRIRLSQGDVDSRLPGDVPPRNPMLVLMLKYNSGGTTISSQYQTQNPLDIS